MSKFNLPKEPQLSAALKQAITDNLKLRNVYGMKMSAKEKKQAEQLPEYDGRGDDRNIWSVRRRRKSGKSTL